MGYGDDDAEGPAGHRPLPPEDRVWRHPAEVALDARRSLRRRRARRVRAGATLIGGALAVSGLVWISRAGPTDVEILAEPMRVGTAADGADDDAELFALAAPASTLAVDSITTSSVIVIRSTDGGALAGGFLVRDGYVVTSSAALDGADRVVVSWGATSEPGTVIGHDDVTDVSVIRVDGSVPDLDHGDARVRQGDEINMSAEDGRTSVHRVVAEYSASAMVDGEPVVGIVELDGRLGDVPPGTPAFDANGDVVGITTATADSAPAAIVPIELARVVAGEIIDDGEATHPWLGVTARNPRSDDGLDRPGSLVTGVTGDGPAAAGGMLTGDLITEIDGRAVESMAAMVAMLRSYEPGDVVEILVWRGDGEINCTVELASHLDVGA